MEIERRTGNAPWRWDLLFSVIVLNVFLPSLVLSYGTLLLHFTNEEETVRWTSLITPVLFIFVYCATQCWCRDAADSWGGNVGHRAMASVGLVVVVVGIGTCAFTPHEIHPIFYGVFGGLGSSLISAQVDAVVFDTYDTRLGIVRGVCLGGQAFGQFIFPYILTIIINYYGLPMTYLLLSGIMLHTLPAILFLKVDNVRRPISYSRFSDLSRAYALFNNDIVNEYYTNEFKLNDLSKKCWKSPSDDNLYREIEADVHNEDDDEHIGTLTPPPSPEDKRRNIFGVEILPDIPEESEESDAENKSDREHVDTKKDSISIAIRKFSTICDDFDECIAKKVRKDSITDTIDNTNYVEIQVVYDNVNPVTEVNHENIFDSFYCRCYLMCFHLKRRKFLPSYRLYKIKRRILYCSYTINDTFIKPLTRSLLCWRFYPAVMLNFAKLGLTAISLPMLPLVSLQIFPKISIAEMNFLMSLHAFTWLCFQLSTPWLVHLAKRNLMYIVVLGLTVTTTACFLVSESRNHDSFSIGCTLAGFGFGAITMCWESTALDFLGPRKWSKVQSTLETLSATLLVLFVICMLTLSRVDDLQTWFVVLGYILGSVTLVWSIIAAVMFYNTKLKNITALKKCFG